MVGFAAWAIDGWLLQCSCLAHCRLAAVFYLGWWGGLVGGVLVFCLLVVSVFACVVGALADSFLFVFVCGSRFLPRLVPATGCRGQGLLFGTG